MPHPGSSRFALTKPVDELDAGGFEGLDKNLHGGGLRVG